MSFCTGFLERKCNGCSASKFLLQLLQLQSTSSFPVFHRTESPETRITNKANCSPHCQQINNGRDSCHSLSGAHPSSSEFHMTLQSPFPLRIFLRSCRARFAQVQTGTHDHSSFRQNLATLSLAPLICCTVGVSVTKVHLPSNSHK